jgi:hypothetical protein
MICWQKSSVWRTRVDEWHFDGHVWIPQLSCVPLDVSYKHSIQQHIVYGLYGSPGTITSTVWTFNGKLCWDFQKCSATWMLAARHRKSIINMTLGSKKL